jgi:hypothetical protein
VRKKHVFSDLPRLGGVLAYFVCGFFSFFILYLTVPPDMDTKVKNLEDEITQLKLQIAMILQANAAIASASTGVVPTASSSASSSSAAPSESTTLVGSGEDEYDGSPQAKDALSIEEKKNLKRVLISKKQLTELRRQRSIKLSDLVRIPSKVSSAPSAKAALALDGTLLGDWPLELVLVRHGQSEGNEAVARSQHGDLSAYTPEFKNKHSSTYRLTDKGIQQAKVAGQWIRENIGEKFDRY